ncbi:MAG: hypothetical protein DHS20C11_08300 [Lysobacteraceae bacterium]|nr:MAG: hypothetical protein DHS20C11_08300 [Xanthomonadaceae bacterium]
MWTISGLSGVGIMVEAQNNRLAVGVHTYDQSNGQPVYFSSFGPLGAFGYYQGTLDYAYGGSCLTCADQQPQVDVGAGGEITIQFLSPVEATVSFTAPSALHMNATKGDEPLTMERMLFGYAPGLEDRFRGTWLLLEDFSYGGLIDGFIRATPFEYKWGEHLGGCQMGNLRTGACSVTPASSSSLLYDEDTGDFVVHTFRPSGGFGITIDQFRFADAGASKTTLGPGQTVGVGGTKGTEITRPSAMVQLFPPGHFEASGQVVTEAGAWAVDGLGGVGMELDMQAGVVGLGTFSYDASSGAPVFHMGAVPYAQLSGLPLDMSMGGSCLACGPGSVIVAPGAGGTASVQLAAMDQGTVAFSAPVADSVLNGNPRVLERLYFHSTLQRLMGKWALVADAAATTEFVDGLVINFTEIVDGVLMGCPAANLINSECDATYPTTVLAQVDPGRGVVVMWEGDFSQREYVFGSIGVERSSIGTMIDFEDPKYIRLSRAVRVLSKSAMTSLD